MMKTGYVVSHSHWDREWRYDIWSTRLMLVDFMDELVELLETGKYNSFLTDGQVSPILDYLEIRPEMGERIKALVAAGKLEMGPWYCLPDEYPVDGEALVRNLLWGYRKSEELGGVLKAGYTSFGWGQTAQLAQVYAGFGFETAMIGKRVSAERAPKNEFLWRSPDGSELLTTRFGVGGRSNFYADFHLHAITGLTYEGKEWRHDQSRSDVLYHRADRERMEQDFFELQAPQSWHPEVVAAEVVEALWETTKDSQIDDHRLFMDGCDYAYAQPLLPEMIEKINELGAERGYKWVHASLKTYSDLMKKHLDRNSIAHVEGELRDGPATHMTGNALATRMDIKLLNKKAQNKLIRFAEPVSVLMAMQGNEYPGYMLGKAWEKLLLAHSHDSINGVVQDDTGELVLGRLHESSVISEALGDDALRKLTKAIDTSAFDKDAILVVVVNPLPYPRREIVEAWVALPEERSEFDEYGEYPEAVQMYDADGNHVATQWESEAFVTYPVVEPHMRAFPFNCARYCVHFDSGVVPAGGYKVFRAGRPDGKHPVDLPYSDILSHTGTLLTAPHQMENEHLIIEVESNGTFSLVDKKSGRVYSDLNYFEERGEIGNYWMNRRPMHGQTYSSIGSNAAVWSENSGPLQATLVSEVTMKLPRKAIPEQERRSDDMVETVIKTTITLKAGERMVHVTVDFENEREDCYLRAMFPTGLKEATHADSGGHFIVDHRPIRTKGPEEGLVWPDMATLPMNNFVDVSDGKNGLAFLSDSFTEYEVTDNDNRIVALSMLRSTKNWICTEVRAGSDFPSQKGGQCLGRFTLNYAICPHEGNWQDARLPMKSLLFNEGCKVVQTQSHEGVLKGSELSLFEIGNPQIIISCLKKSHDSDSFVLRVYNPTAETQTTDVKFHAQVSKAELTDLNEQCVEGIEVKNGAIGLSVEPYRIATVKFSA
ncbi:MAG: glycoside hydrolase family 38 C-terminal domain-containing protein [Verrucomicrobiota bacterium]